jgi:hypothetical protein
VKVEHYPVQTGEEVRLMERLFDSGFKTAIVFTSGNDQSLVRGTVMGASHLCIENYIAPALESIKATRMKVRNCQQV